MTFREFYETVGWKYYGDKSVRVDTPLGIISPSTPGVFGALPAQVSGSEPAEMPLWSGGFGSTNWQKPDFDLKLPEESITGQIVGMTQNGKNWSYNAKGGEDHTKDVVITLQIGKNKTRNFSVPLKAIKQRMENKPERGKTCTIVLQRTPDSADQAPAQIQKIQVF